MQYPSRSEYCTSIRNPQFAFRKKDSLTKIEYNLDSNLVNGKAIEKIKLDGTKDIWSASGGFAIVFKFETFFPSKIWAIRCFYRCNFEIKNHYKSALSRIKNTPCHPYFVDFSFLEEGIRVQGNCYPILKMEWVEGENLKKFIKANLDNSDSLKILAELWITLSKQLLSSGIAHGDLQHGNILIVKCYNHLAIKLIDYDSLYFFEDASSIDDNIKGLNDYQHPLRKKLIKRCLEVDFFPQLVIYISILALAEDKKLWETYRVDEKEGLLFSSSDFQDPDRASIFRSLAKLPHPLPELANKLKEICQFKDFGDIPSLANVLFNEKEYIPNQKDGSLHWQANDLRYINLFPSREQIANLLRQSVSKQTEIWKSISDIKFSSYFAAKTEAKSQDLGFRVPSQLFTISLKHKVLTDYFNPLNSSTLKVLTILVKTK
ncbi:MAG: protein kinase family protein, partial [Chroococcidiopsidaceae cyanobacterium CP_BM_RX_35]|nr:protein kinase family protein [Chroococcidiopsidaceae cyanobacterium CP_BM_RX_35]